MFLGGKYKIIRAYTPQSGVMDATKWRPQTAGGLAVSPPEGVIGAAAPRNFLDFDRSKRQEMHSEHMKMPVYRLEKVSPLYGFQCLEMSCRHSNQQKVVDLKIKLVTYVDINLHDIKFKN